MANGGYTTNIIDSGWVLSSAVVALAVWQPWALTKVPMRDWSAFVIPATFGAVALGLLVYDHFYRVHLLALVLAATCVAAVIGRMSLIFKQYLGMLRDSRIDASTDLLTGLGNRRQLLADLAAAEGADATSCCSTWTGSRSTTTPMAIPPATRSSRDSAAGWRHLPGRCRGLQARRGRILRSLPRRRPCRMSTPSPRPTRSASTATASTSRARTASRPCQQTPDDPIEVLRVADQRMYTQKHGREQLGRPSEQERPAECACRAEPGAGASSH